MKNTVTISVNEYQELLQKAAANDSVQARLNAVTQENELLKAKVEEYRALFNMVTIYSNQLENALAEERKKREALEDENKNLSDRVAKLNDMLFGNKGNKTGKEEPAPSEPEEQPFSEFNDAEVDAAVEELIKQVNQANQERKDEKNKTKEETELKKAQGRRLRNLDKFANLPIHENHLYPEGYDPEKHVLIGKEIRDILRRIPAQVYLERFILYVCKDKDAGSGKVANEDSTNILKAQMPVLPFKGVNVGADFMAWVISSKFIYSMPEYRMIRMLKQEGISYLSTSTLNGWLKRAAEKLYPLYLQQKNLVLESDYVQGDEVPYNVADRKGEPVRKGSSFQVYDASEEKRGSVFVYDEGSRAGEIPKKIFRNYRGAAQFDGYAGYNWLREKDGVVVLSCLAHVIRKFRDCVKTYKEEDARLFYNAIQAMYGVDHTLQERGADYETIKNTRLKKTRPIFEALAKAVKMVRPKVRPKSGFGRALKYFMDNEEGIRNVFKDGRYHWDNNPCERRNRTTTIGRNAYLFAKNNDTAENLAVFYTFTETLMELGINAQEYLEHVLNLPLEEMTPEELRKELPYFYARKLKVA